MNTIDHMVQANAWANHLLAEHIADTDIEALRLFGHSLAAENNWLARMLTGVDAGSFWPKYEAADLPGMAKQVLRKWETTLKHFDGRLDDAVEYVDTRGTAYTVPAGQMMVQALTHAWFHRGEVYRLLDIAGRRPDDTDSIIHHHHNHMKHPGRG